MAPDKFRGTSSAARAATVIATAVESLGHEAVPVPLADGGEGLLEVLGGANRTTTVTDPLGDPVEAPWRMAGRTAVIEMARASGLALVGGAEENDPVAASTYGTGELVAAALDAGAKRIVVGVGGSATTDGGLGALRAMMPLQRLRGVELVVACDVRLGFVDAARVFAPQKGASPAQVELLERRLERLVQVYLDEYGVDVSDLEGAGAAGGLAGGLAAAGATLIDGFDLVAEHLDLDELVESADVVVTVTSSAEPLFPAAAVSDRALICAVGATKYDRCEIDPALVARCAAVVCDDVVGSQVECGDLIAAVAQGRFSWDAAIELHDVLAGNVAVARAGAAPVLFETQGVALQDIAVAALAYSRYTANRPD